MKRLLAGLLASMLLAGCAAAETRVYSFQADQPPAELLDTAMAVMDGTVDVKLTFAGACTLGGETGGGARRFARVVQREGYAYPMANLQSVFAADDLTLVNLEGVLSDAPLKKVKKQFNFLGETAYTQILTLGSVECVTLANNHAMDYGSAGKQDTLDALDKANIAVVDENTLCILEKDGIRIGITASVMGLNQQRFLRQAEVLRNLGCATIVHVMHMGQEYAQQPTAGQTKTARFLAQQGVTLVVGHHPHVVQGLEQIENTLVAYSMGNCVFGGNTDPEDTDACLLGATFRFSEGALQETQVTIWPIRTSGDARSNDYQPLLLTGSEAARVVDKIQSRSGMTLAPYRDGEGAVQTGMKQTEVEQ